MPFPFTNEANETYRFANGATGLQHHAFKTIKKSFEWVQNEFLSAKRRMSELKTQ
jgi:hypothetical protein